MTDTCSWKRCRAVGDYVSVTADKNGTYNLCEKHWKAVAEKSGSVKEQLTKVAIPTYPKLGD